MTHEEQNGLVDRIREHVQDWESKSDMFPLTMQARSIDLIDEAADALAALQAPQEVGECATDGCGNTATGRFESGGVGSHHCPSCLAKIAALSQPEAQAVPEGWKLVPNGDPIELDDCPVGLFVFKGRLCFMSEYSTLTRDDFRQRDAYVVESGEYFWGATNNARSRAILTVQPLMLAASPATGGA